MAERVRSAINRRHRLLTPAHMRRVERVPVAVRTAQSRRPHCRSHFASSSYRERTGTCNSHGQPSSAYNACASLNRCSIVVDNPDLVVVRTSEYLVVIVIEARFSSNPALRRSAVPLNTNDLALQVATRMQVGNTAHREDQLIVTALAANAFAVDAHSVTAREDLVRNEVEFLFVSVVHSYSFP